MKVVRMNGREAFRFEMSVQVGTQVMATWTKGQSIAIVTAVNAKSFSLEVSGQALSIPKFATPGYSSNNCILPANIFE